MSGLAEDGARRLRDLYEAKVRAELDEGDADGGPWVPWSGDPLAAVVAVKGYPGEAERAGGAALSGADGEALRRAFDAIGRHEPLFLMCSRPADGSFGTEVAVRLRSYLATVDPSLVIALDAEAAQDVAAALGLKEGPRPGTPAGPAGTKVLAVDGLEASLADERRKARVWKQFQALRDLGE